LNKRKNWNIKFFSKLKGFLIYLVISIVVIILVVNPFPCNLGNKSLWQESIKEKNRALLATSSSNGGGYLMNDSASYSWIEISTSGTLLNISNENDDYEVISFDGEGWNFTLYEEEYNNIFVSTNGWMSFTNLSDTESMVSSIPDLSDKNKDCIALLCTDLNPNNGGEIYYEFRNKSLIIEYDDVYSVDGNLVGSFEVIFNQSGTIKFQYQNINYLSQYDAIVGLDHGDLINYNSYSHINTNNLPLLSKAIEFTFDKINEVNYSINVAINNEHSWIVSEIDNPIMDKIFGSNWEETYGLLSDPLKFTKFKINISAIIENTTHWKINYNIWNWTNKETNFNVVPDGNDNLLFKREPKNYTIPHNLTHVFPFFIPNPIYHYLNNSNLFDSDSRISRYDSTGEYVELGDTIMSSTIIEGHIIKFGRNARYNKYGLLDWMDFYYSNQSWELSDKKSIFTIYNFYDSPKPSFIGVNEAEVHNYGVFYSERNAPLILLKNYDEFPGNLSLSIDFIGGFDPYYNRSLIITSNDEIYSLISPFPVDRNSRSYYLEEGFTQFTRLYNFIISTELNWTYLDLIRSDISTISNGFIFSLTILDINLEFEYTYNSVGLLNTYSEYNNGKEYFTVRLEDFNYQIDDSDPIIFILSPSYNQSFGKIAPNYTLSIIEPNLDKIWYTIDGGISNVTVTSLTGTIDQTIWNTLPEGNLTLEPLIKQFGILYLKEI
jgi:hypothetical protein